MKKILFHLFLLASLFMAACHDDNGGPSSIVIDKDQQNQTAYADDTEKTIRFEATEAWHTEVDYTATKATETVEKWVTAYYKDPKVFDVPEGYIFEKRRMRAKRYDSYTREQLIRELKRKDTKIIYLQSVIESKG